MLPPEWEWREGIRIGGKGERREGGSGYSIYQTFFLPGLDPAMPGDPNSHPGQSAYATV